MPTTLPATGPLALSNVNYVLSFANNRVIGLDDFIVRSLFVRPTGTISIADGRGKAVGGTQSYLTAGTYYFTVPAYVNMTVTVKGAGGGGDGGNYRTLVDSREGSDVYNTVFGGSGSTGGGSSFGSSTPMIANGGGGGNAVNGTASGGATNTTGGAANRGAGGITVTVGGDAAGNSTATNGGHGGLSVRTFVRDSGGPTVGAIIAVVVGAAGAGGTKAAGAGSNGTAGGVGSVLITWIGVN